MQRIAHDTKSVDLFGSGKHGYTEGDVDLNIPPTVVTDDWLNSVQEEIANSIENAGITLDVDVRTQLYSAILKVGAGLNRLAGFGLSIGTDAAHDIDIAAGMCMDFTNVQAMFKSSTVTKQIDAAWAAGSAAGGFPSGGSLLTLTNNTWYAVYAIGKTTDKTAIDFGFDSSLTAANLLHASNAGGSGFNLYRRIGWIRYGTATIVPFFQDGDYFTWDAASFDANAVTGNTSGNTITLLAPPSTMAIFMANFTSASGTRYLRLAEVRQTAAAASATNYHLKAIASTYVQSAEMRRLVDASSNIYHRTDNTATTLDIFTRGWIDVRGK